MQRVIVAPAKAGVQGQPLQPCRLWIPASAGMTRRNGNALRFLDSFLVRRFGAKPDKKIVDRSSGKSEFMEDTVHGNSDGMVVGVDRFWVVRAAGWAEWLSGGEKGFDGFVSENEQRGHRPQTGW